MDKIDPDLLRRYVQQHCTAQERDEVEAWMRAGEPNDSFVSGNTKRTKLKDEVWMQLVQARNKPVPSRSRRISQKVALFGVAAVVLTLVFVYPLLKEKIGPKQEQVAYELVEVPYGKKKKLRMADGTLVHLNSGSVFRYPTRFERKQRLVFLRGEGFFEVAKDEKRPFLISTERSLTRVLGTRFNLRDYAAEQTPKITLLEGMVAYSGRDGKNPMLVKAHEEAFWTGKVWAKRVVNGSHTADWKDNVIHLENLTLAEAVPVLERWYNVKIDFDPNLAALQLNGSFQNPPLEKLLKDISYITNIQYTLKNRHVLLHH
ncbi:hypothetical protein GCM10023231_12980 [Olivibacter ginsenosidimutans]|uniref:DUF4974 domain-containing protein n=1 Tax=Olivibacter ginsenosidimutans TaxID=1176537 RepID=A0ABP9AUR8_9SPHI